MATIDNIITRAEGIRDETTIGANTATRVGSVMVDTADHVKQNEQDIVTLNADVFPLKHEEILKPTTFDTATTACYPPTGVRYPCSSSYSNSSYKGKTITDIYINMYSAGNLSILIGTNVASGSTTSSYTVHETFNVVVGVNKLHLSTPITITSDTTFIGITSTNAQAKYYVNGSGTKFLYDNSGTIATSSGSISICFIADKDINAEISTLETAVTQIPSIQSEINSIDSSIYPLIHVDAVKPSTFSTATANAYPGNSKRFPTDSSRSNKSYRGKAITDIWVNVYNAGTITVILGSNIYTGSTTATTTNVESFSVVVGVNKLHLTTPILVTTDTDFVGIVGGGAQNGSIKYDVNGNGGTKFYYLSGSNVSTSNGSLSVYFVCDNDIASEIPALSSAVDELQLKTKLIPYPPLDSALYYHWNPDGFTKVNGQNGIPSQSVEDNLLASRLGFKFVEANVQATSDGHYIITHGQTINGVDGCFGNEFNDTYKSVQISSMTLSDIIANVTYNSDYACYNHHPSTAEEFMASCAQLGLGVYIRSTSSSLLNIVRSYIEESKIIIAPLYLTGCKTMRDNGFRGMLSWYISSGTASTICDVDYIRNFVETNGGTPFHICFNATYIQYMIDNDLLDSIVPTLRKDGIYIGAAYASTQQVERLISAGGWGVAAQNLQCNTFGDANVGAWSLTDADLSSWTIPSGVSVVGGQIINNSGSSVTIKTPSTGEIAVGKGSVQIRANGNIDYAIGSQSPATMNGCTSDHLIIFARARLNSDLQLSITIPNGGSVDFLNYQVSRC